MKQVLLILSLSAAVYTNAQVANHVVLSEIYGGGGNAGAAWRNDFIELYNPTSTPVSLAGWSVQYASATGTAWQITNLSGTIPAKGFYLVQEAQGAGGSANLPTPDATGNIAMSATAGKVALVNATVALSGACPAGAQIVDFAGFGGTANCFEGAGPTPAPSNTTSLERKASPTSTAATLAFGGAEETAGNGYDANSNSTDFVAQVLASINPQNTGSPIEGSVGSTVSAAAGISPAEPATDGTFTIMLSVTAPAGGVTVTYSLNGSATSGTDYTDVQAGSITIPMGSSSGTINIDMIDDLLPEGNETIVITVLTANAGYTISGANATITITDNDAITRIHAIQGSGTTAAAGTFTAEGIVTGVYPLLSPAGFYMQEEDADADADPNTSEGIFVVSAASVAVGDKASVTGTVQENASTPSFDQAVFSTATVTVLSNSNPIPVVTDISLPVTAVSDFEKYEGMLVRFPTTLTVTNNFTLGRFGEVGLSANGSVYQPSQIIDPNDAVPSGTNSSGASNVAAINAQTLNNTLRTILLDDGRNTTTTLPYADPVDNTLRLGSTVSNLTGITGFAFGVYRIQPIPTAMPSFTYAPRPSLPSLGGASLKIASFNVLNYFNGNGLGGGFPTTRGANSPAEFSRQRAKIISAISEINADIVGLMEMENDGVGPNSAIQDLVNGLNAVLGSGTYSIINDGANIQTYGTDEIHCGIIYKSAIVMPTGPAMLSPSSIFNRPPLAQTFTLLSSNSTFNVIINHFKSKGCTGSAGADLDQADGQACFNDRRKQQAAGLLHFIDTAVIPLSGTNRIISIGDYNAYYEEDPLDILRAANYTVLSTSSTYSYQFDGQIGSLDHAIVSSSMNPYVTGIHKWNINAAEPVYLDYNDAVDDGGSDFVNPFAGTYTVSPYRSSDHDPVLIGLNLSAPLSISLINFDASKQNNAARLNWTTAREINSREFIVERSANGTEWQAIAGVPAAGNSHTRLDYTAYDQAPLTGNNLYRLKSVDMDNTFDYSLTRRVNFGDEFTYSIYPNPARDVIQISGNNWPGATAEIEIMNAQKQVLVKQETSVAASLVSINVSSLRPGFYFIKIIAPDGSVHPGKFVKQ